MTVQDFSAGWISPVLAYGMSVLGCALGLSGMSRSRATEGRARMGWIAVGAVAIGGTGIWVMHFIAILGLAVPGQEVTYALAPTLLSMLLAIVVVGAGLCAAVYGKGRTPALVIGGVFTGLGVASMHYLGMSAIRVDGTISYRPVLVLLSIVIAIVASIVALWFAVNVRGLGATLGAAMVMGVAVTGMHYVGMAAMLLYPTTGTAPAAGLTGTQLLMPLIAGIGLTTVVMIFIVGLAPSEDEIIQNEQAEAAFRGLHSR